MRPRSPFRALLYLETLAFRRAGPGGSGPGGKLLEHPVMDWLSFLFPLLAMGGIGWAVSVFWEYGSVFTTRFLSMALLFFILLGFTAQNMGHLVHAHRGNLFMRSLPLPNGAFARAKMIVLLLFGAIWSFAFLLPGTLARISFDLSGVAMDATAWMGAAAGVLWGMVVAAVSAVLVLSLAILIYRAGWIVRWLRPHLSSVLSLIMVVMLGILVVWTSTQFTESQGLSINIEPGALVWWLPPAWLAALQGLLEGHSQPQALLAAGLAVAVAGVLWWPALAALGGLLVEEPKQHVPSKGRPLWPAFLGVQGALMFVISRHALSEPRLKETVPSLILLSYLPLGLVWYRPGDMAHIYSPGNQVSWGIDLQVGFALMVVTITCLTAALIVHRLRFAPGGDGGLRFRSLPIPAYAAHRAAVTFVLTRYLIPILIATGITWALIFWGVTDRAGALDYTKIKYSLAMVGILAVDTMFVLRLDSLLDPCLPLSRDPEEGDVYPVWLSIILPAVALGALAGATVRAFYLESANFLPFGVYIPLAMVAFLIITAPMERRRLASQR